MREGERGRERREIPLVDLRMGKSAWKKVVIFSVLREDAKNEQLVSSSIIPTLFQM